MRVCSTIFGAKAWKILIVDDEPDVITVTKLVLSDYDFEGKGIEFLEARSAREAIDLMSKHNDIAVVLLDVVMEKDSSGLEVVKYIRETLGNHSARIIIRTGQPGEFPESQIINNYDINDYVVKAELTEENLKNSLTVAFRSFCDISTVEFYKTHLQELVNEKTSELKELNAQLEDKVTLETNRRLEHEQMLIQQSKMAMMGEMISIIAHQWSQPLTVLSGMISDLETGKLNMDEVVTTAKSCKQQIGYMSKTVRDFSQFFKPSKLKDSFQVAESIQNSLGLLSYTLRQNDIEVSIKNDIGDINIFGNKNEFEQIVLNIVKNSLDAISDKNDSMDPFDRQKQHIKIVLAKEGDFVLIRFIDEAGGIPKEVLSKVFDMYFTTKGEEKGTGIGLYMVKMIVEKSFGGNVDIYNSNGGAVVELRMKV
jgi:signal transduction histidine kinase